MVVRILARYAGLSGAVAHAALRDAVRGRLVLGLGAVTLLLLGLFAFAARTSLDAARAAAGTATEDVTGATLLGTAAFVTLLLGGMVAVLLSHGAVRGDAEAGVLGPLAVRPVPRAVLVLGRVLAGTLASAAYTATTWLATIGLVQVAGGWGPDAWLVPGLALAGGAATVAVATVLLSTALPAQAAGIAALGLLGLGFTGGLLAQLGASLDIASLRTVADAISLALPFEALYRHVLGELGAAFGDLSGIGVAIGPFGGAQRLAAADLVAVGAWTVLVVVAAVWRTVRLDLA